VKFDATSEGAAECRTREAVTRLLMERGPQTAASLGTMLELSPVGIRRHLEALMTDGLVAAHDRKPLGHRGRGRPAKVFALTEAGRESFPHAYDDLAVSALKFLSAQGGDDAVRAFAEQRIAVLEKRFRERLARASTREEKIQALAETLTAEGYAASAAAVGSGEQLCQHHCPVAHVAAEFPQLCEAETQALSRALGTHVQRLATIARGDGMCTTHIPAEVATPNSATVTIATASNRAFESTAPGRTLA
jgi:predicted ArsR family transcriptional regulator